MFGDYGNDISKFGLWNDKGAVSRPFVRGGDSDFPHIAPVHFAGGTGYGPEIHRVARVFIMHRSMIWSTENVTGRAWQRFRFTYVW